MRILSVFIGWQIAHLPETVEIVNPRLNRVAPPHEIDEPVKVFPDLRMGPGHAISVDHGEELFARVRGMQGSGKGSYLIQGNVKHKIGITAQQAAIGGERVLARLPPFFFRQHKGHIRMRPCCGSGYTPDPPTGDRSIFAGRRHPA